MASVSTAISSGLALGLEQIASSSVSFYGLGLMLKKAKVWPPEKAYFKKGTPKEVSLR